MKHLHWLIVWFIVWFIVALASAYACQLAVAYTTPIDHALPFLALLITLIAACSRSSLMIGVPLLIAAEIAFPGEGVRLLALGVVMAGVVVGGLIGTNGTDGTPPPSSVPSVPLVPFVPPLITVALVLLLRWIPWEGVLLGREAFLLVLAVLIMLVLGKTPFAVAVGVLTVLVTPAVPLRTLALPVAVLVVGAVARVLGMRRVVLAWPSAMALAFVTLFFPWSGVLARAVPYLLRRSVPEARRLVVGEALSPGGSTTLDVPQGARSLVVSGANVPRLRRGAPLGRIDPGGEVIRIGDAADWGSLRREQFYNSDNPLPRDPAGRIRGYGYAAWIDGAGRVALPAGARKIRVTAAATLPPDAKLQVEGFEIDE